MIIKLNTIALFNLLVLLTSCNGQTTRQDFKTDNIVKGNSIDELGKSVMVIYQDRKNNY